MTKNATRKVSGKKVKVATKHGPIVKLVPCGCGCGAMVKRRFRPGHDARLKSALLKKMKKGNAEATNELKKRKWIKT